MPKSPEEMAAAMMKNLKANTGKDMPAWLKIVKKSGLEKHGQIVKFLKTEHGVTHGYASLIAHESINPYANAPAGDDLIESQYSGPKADLRPIYDAIAKAVAKFGSDVEIAPKKTYVSLRRKKQFAIVQPSTKTRVDVGINLKGAEPTERLEASGSFNTMVSHRVRVSAKKEVDAELKGWLKDAYDAAG